MNDPLFARFADACGATDPLDLRVDLVDGGLLAEGSVCQPFTLVGRDDACDVTLSDPEINPRHAWFQVIGGRVFATDLGSRAGLLWHNGGRGPGWLDVGTPVRIGPFALRLRAPVSKSPAPCAPDFNPLAATKERLPVALEFKNGRRAKDRWQVNRVITLIGRAPDCKIHLTADDISHYHCGLVSTPTGMWVVDLSGRGVVVNGERMRVAPLPHGAELWVGRFLIGCHHTPQVPPPTPRPVPAPLPPPTGKSGRFGPLAAPPAAKSPGDETQADAPPGVLTPVPPPPAPTPYLDDEVELGAATDPDVLSASHIMSDAFRQWGPAGSNGMSQAIHVSGAPSKPPAANPGPTHTPLIDESFPDGDWSVAPLLRQMADLHGRTVAEFHQALALVGQMFVRVRGDHLTVLQHELARIQDISAEIVAIQGDVARQLLESAAAERARQLDAGEPRPGVWTAPSARTPFPDGPSAPPTSSARAADRLAALHHERAARWQSLIALFTGTP